jgi:prepilin signal peptidase PulO-like enzyme (type II secretory pathway)
MLLVFFASRACIGRTTILIVGTIVAALIAVASGAVAWRLARQVEQLPAESPVVAERLGFYANGGVYVSGLSVLVILMVLVTAIILGSSCR